MRLKTTGMLVIGLVSVALMPLYAQDQGGSLTADKLFDPAHLVEVRIKIAEADWDVLTSQGRTFVEALGKTPMERPFTYFNASAVIDGVAFEGVRVRKKGFIGSLDEERPSLKIRFAKDAPISGVDRLTLNNNKQDRSLLSQYLGYKLFNQVGIISPRCNLAKVTVNGQYLGIYSHVESVRAPFLQRSFGDSSGDLFEGTVADLFVDRLERFELKTKTTDLKTLKRVATILKKKRLDVRALDRVLDVDAFIRYWAMESLTGFWDGYANNQNNYFMYRDPKKARFYFIPWGLDDAFTNSFPIPPYRLKIKSVHGSGLLPIRLYANSKMRERYLQTLVGLLRDHWKEEAILADMDRMEKLLEGSIPREQGDFPKALAKVRRFVQRRRAVMERELDKWPLEVRTEPKIPVYFKTLGTAVGTFSTKWNDKAPSDPFSNGKAELKLILDGKEVQLKVVGVSAERSTMGEERPRPPAIVFSGKRRSGGKRVTVAFGLSIGRFRPTDGETVKVEGVMFEGFAFDAMQWMTGEASFEKASMKNGDPVVGRVSLAIVKMVGGE